MNLGIGTIGRPRVPVTPVQRVKIALNPYFLRLPLNFLVGVPARRLRLG